MSKHTPGPWKVSTVDSFPGQIKILTNGPKYIGNVFTEAPGFLDENANANAHIVAAAPDMFEILTHIKTQFGDGIGEKLDAWITRALKKAKGES